jgi:hypothetical protein
LAVAARLSAIRSELDRLDDQISVCDTSERRRFGAWATALRCAADGLSDDVEAVAGR